MSSQLKYDIARLTGIPALFHRLNRNRLLVLAYHGIYDGPKRTGLLPETFVHVDDMTEQLIYFKKRYNVVSPEDVLDSIERGSILPPDSALVTFDDGYESFCRLAAPVLKGLQIKAIVFVSTRYMDRHEPFWFDMLWYFFQYSTFEDIERLCGLLDINKNQDKGLIKKTVFGKMKRMPLEKRDDLMFNVTRRACEEDGSISSMISLFYPMAYEQIKYLSADDAVFFGGHTHSHTILSAINEQEAAEEIRINKEKIEQNLNKPCVFFAYPNGSQSDFNEIHKNILMKAGHRAAFSLTQKRSIINKDPFDISRVHIAPEDNIKSLDMRFSGISPYILEIKNLVRYIS
jgi:peptidoglycan/xylan/chitin deacetylase (PgdA/CDA1 family)